MWCSVLWCRHFRIHRYIAVPELNQLSDGRRKALPGPASDCWRTPATSSPRSRSGNSWQLSLTAVPARRRGTKHPTPELIVLVDFKAIYPGVPPGIFASFLGVAHFLSFEEICQYPRVPQGKVANPWGTLGYYFPGVDPREIKTPGVHLTFLKHLNITNFLNEQYLVLPSSLWCICGWLFTR